MNSKASISFVLKGLFHLIPLVGFYLDKPYLGIALVLLVVLCYVKVMKINAELNHLESKGLTDNENYASLKGTLKFWLKFTFLRGEA